MGEQNDGARDLLWEALRDKFVNIAQAEWIKQCVADSGRKPSAKEIQSFRTWYESSLELDARIYATIDRVTTPSLGGTPVDILSGGVVLGVGVNQVSAKIPPGWLLACIFLLVGIAGLLRRQLWVLIRKCLVKISFPTFASFLTSPVSKPNAVPVRSTSDSDQRPARRHR